MKQLASTVLLLAAVLHSLAQNPIPDFGKIEKADLEMSSCDFDKDAEALVLFDDGEFFCNIIYGAMIDPVQMQIERRVRIKILKDKGLNRANIHIKYYSFGARENVKGISAQTYNLDEAGNIKITKLDKKLVYDKKLNKRYSEIAFTLPEVKVGSVIEYKYTIEGVGARRWYFQQSIPVQLSRYAVNFPNEIEMSCVPHCQLPYSSKKEERSGRDVQVYSMEKIPALRDEAYISCEDDYLQSMEPRFVAINQIGQPRKSLVRTWPGIIKQLMEDDDFGVQLKKNIPRTKDLDSMLLNISSPYQKMTLIHHYVRKNMEWNKYDNIWALEGVRAAWKDKKGTSAEINLILVNLLKDAGLDAHPILVSTRENGRINTFVPGFDQFDKVMAYVEIDDNNYVLDAVEKFTPSNLIPLEVMASQGLVIEKIETQQWGWRTLWSDKALFSNTIFINAAIDSSGQMKGHAIISSDGYARVTKMPALTEGKKAFTDKYFSSQNSTVKIDSIVFDNEKTDTLPFTQNIFFNQELNASGDYRYFNANMFSGLEKNPFVEDNRFSDIFFGYNQRISIVGNIEIPDGYELEDLPKNIRMIMPDTSISFTRLAGKTQDILSFRVSLEFKKPVFNVDEYPEFKEFYKKLFDLLNEQFVIRKKS
jgi:hypothetical protein